MEKDADPLTPGVQTLNNLWLMKNGCQSDQQKMEGKGCLAVEKWVFEADDIDACNDDDDGDGAPCDPTSPHGPLDGPVDTNGGEQPEGVGAWEEQKKFDHKIVSLDPQPDNTWLESGGRIANCTLTIVTENWILEGCVTKDDPSVPGIQLGPEGDGLIERIIVLPLIDDLKFRIRPTKDNGIVTDIIDENCEVADYYGEPLPETVQGGLTAVCGDVHLTVRMLEGDLNLDCVVDVVDDQMAAYRYGASFGLLLYDPWFDLEPKFTDFDIDIKDMQFVFGRNFSTCQAPIPDQLPQSPPEF